MLSVGMFAARALSISVRSRALDSGLPPPARAATVISLASTEKIFPRLASMTALCRLVVCHLL